MAHDAIIEKLKDMMKASSQTPADWSAVTADSTIAELGFDSLSILDLIYDIQQTFSIEFEAEDMVEVKTVGQLADFLSARGAQG
jgi:acyl carrier protein